MGINPLSSCRSALVLVPVALGASCSKSLSIGTCARLSSMLGQKMKVVCSKCRNIIPAGQINIQTMKALCQTCDVIVNIGDEMNVECKPLLSKIEYTETADGFVLLFPRRNVRGLAWFFVAFGGFWDLISGVMLVATFGSKKAVDPMFFIIVPPFFVLGSLILLGGIALLFLRTGIVADKSGIKIIRKTLGREFIGFIEKNAISGVRKVERYQSNNRPVYGVSIQNGDGEGKKVGVELSDDEIGWIRYLINKWKLS
jgi:hypothetical protein